uniref:HTH cro/C1-type domain-containing protein n=1 Tax=Nannochloropsis gaditana (strain CCMP526) TaxID=1093141 RepID=I2CQM6_NANGC
MADGGWTTVTAKPKKKPATGGARPAGVTQPWQTRSTASSASTYTGGGAASSAKKYAAGENKSAHTNTGANLRKLEEETEDFHVARVDRSFSVALAQARMGKGLSQKELATRICEKPSVINDYEGGRAIPNPNIINKLDRALGVHLPRGKKK